MKIVHPNIIQSYLSFEMYKLYLAKYDKKEHRNPIQIIEIID
jgi:hypothetical protein